MKGNKTAASVMFQRVLALLMLTGALQCFMLAPSGHAAPSTSVSPNQNQGPDQNPGTAWDIRKNYFLRYGVARQFGPFNAGGADVIENQRSTGPGLVRHSRGNDPVFVWPVPVPFAISSVPTHRDEAIQKDLFQTFGYPVSDTQFQIIQRYNDNRMLEQFFDPERWMWLATTTAGMQATSAGNAAANQTVNQDGSAIDYCKRYIRNFAAEEGNKWQQVRDKLFIPMAVLLLLPGAVLAQARALVAQGSPVLGGDINPLEGLLRSVIAIFLIPGTLLVINYGIDVANSITFTIADEYQRIFGSDMYNDAICDVKRAFPINPAERNDNGIFEQEQPPQPNQTVWDPYEALNFNLREYDPCNNIDNTRTEDERVRDAKKISRFLGNTMNSGLSQTWNVMCAFQIAFLYYLWCMGPIAGACWVWPIGPMRKALPNWIEGVVTLCFWCLFWNTVILLMACFKGVGDNGLVLTSALNFLANAAVKYAFDFSGLVSAAGSAIQSDAKAAAGNAAKQASRAAGGAPGTPGGATPAGSPGGVAGGGGGPGALGGSGPLTLSQLNAGLQAATANASHSGLAGNGGQGLGGMFASHTPPGAGFNPFGLGGHGGHGGFGGHGPDPGLPPPSGPGSGLGAPGGILPGLMPGGPGSPPMFGGLPLLAPHGMPLGRGIDPRTGLPPVAGGGGGLGHGPMGLGVGPDGSLHLSGHPDAHMLQDAFNRYLHGDASGLQQLMPGGFNLPPVGGFNPGNLSPSDLAAINSFAHGHGGLALSPDGTLLNAATGMPLHLDPHTAAALSGHHHPGMGLPGSHLPHQSFNPLDPSTGAHLGAPDANGFRPLLDAHNHPIVDPLTGEHLLANQQGQLVDGLTHLPINDPHTHMPFMANQVDPNSGFVHGADGHMYAPTTGHEIGFNPITGAPMDLATGQNLNLSHLSPQQLHAAGLDGQHPAPGHALDALSRDHGFGGVHFTDANNNPITDFNNLPANQPIHALGENGQHVASYDPTTHQWHPVGADGQLQHGVSMNAADGHWVASGTNTPLTHVPGGADNPAGQWLAHNHTYDPNTGFVDAGGVHVPAGQFGAIHDLASAQGLNDVHFTPGDHGQLQATGSDAAGNHHVVASYDSGSHQWLVGDGMGAANHAVIGTDGQITAGGMPLTHDGHGGLQTAWTDANGQHATYDPIHNTMTVGHDDIGGGPITMAAGDFHTAVEGMGVTSFAHDPGSSMVYGLNHNGDIAMSYNGETNQMFDGRGNVLNHGPDGVHMEGGQMVAGSGPDRIPLTTNEHGELVTNDGHHLPYNSNDHSVTAGLDQAGNAVHMPVESYNLAQEMGATTFTTDPTGMVHGQDVAGNTVMSYDSHTGTMYDGANNVLSHHEPMSPVAHHEPLPISSDGHGGLLAHDHSGHSYPFNADTNEVTVAPGVTMPADAFAAAVHEGATSFHQDSNGIVHGLDHPGGSEVVSYNPATHELADHSGATVMPSGDSGFYFAGGSGSHHHHGAHDPLSFNSDGHGGYQTAAHDSVTGGHYAYNPGNDQVTVGHHPNGGDINMSSSDFLTARSLGATSFQTDDHGVVHGFNANHQEVMSFDGHHLATADGTVINHGAGAVHVENGELVSGGGLRLEQNGHGGLQTADANHLPYNPAHGGTVQVGDHEIPQGAYAGLNRLAHHHGEEHFSTLPDGRINVGDVTVAMIDGAGHIHVADPATGHMLDNVQITSDGHFVATGGHGDTITLGFSPETGGLVVEGTNYAYTAAGVDIGGGIVIPQEAASQQLLQDAAAGVPIAEATLGALATVQAELMEHALHGDLDARAAVAASTHVDFGVLEAAASGDYLAQTAVMAAAALENGAVMEYVMHAAPGTTPDMLHAAAHGDAHAEAQILANLAMNNPAVMEHLGHMGVGHQTVAEASHGVHEAQDAIIAAQNAIAHMDGAAIAFAYHSSGDAGDGFDASSGFYGLGGLLAEQFDGPVVPTAEAIVPETPTPVEPEVAPIPEQPAVVVGLGELETLDPSGNFTLDGASFVNLDAPDVGYSPDGLYFNQDGTVTLSDGVVLESGSEIALNIDGHTVNGVVGENGGIHLDGGGAIHGYSESGGYVVQTPDGQVVEGHNGQVFADGSVLSIGPDGAHLIHPQDVDHIHADLPAGVTLVGDPTGLHLVGDGTVQLPGVQVPEAPAPDGNIYSYHPPDPVEVTLSGPSDVIQGGEVIQPTVELPGAPQTDQLVLEPTVHHPVNNVVEAPPTPPTDLLGDQTTDPPAAPVVHDAVVHDQAPAQGVTPVDGAQSFEQFAKTDEHDDGKWLFPNRGGGTTDDVIEHSPDPTIGKTDDAQTRLAQGPVPGQPRPGVPQGVPLPLPTILRGAVPPGRTGQVAKKDGATSGEQPADNSGQRKFAEWLAGVKKQTGKDEKKKREEEQQLLAQLWEEEQERLRQEREDPNRRRDDDTRTT